MAHKITFNTNYKFVIMYKNNGTTLCTVMLVTRLSVGECSKSTPSTR